MTEQRRLERRAEHTLAVLERSLSALSAHIVIVDATGAVVASNIGWQRSVPERRQMALATARPVNYLKICADAPARRLDAKRIASSLRSVLAGERRTSRLLYRTPADGLERWFQLSAVRLECDGEIYLVIAKEEVTALKEAEQMLGNISERLLALQQEERQRIAEDLHDSTAQHLAAIGLNLMRLKAETSTSAPSHSLLQEIDSCLDEASKELRSFTYLMHPPCLEQDGLGTTLRRYVEGFGKRSGLRVKLRAAQGVDALPLPAKRSIFRIVQEALANVHRHASASQVCVDLRCVLERLHVIIRDDGRGIDTNMASKREPSRPSSLGVGIPGIRARLRQFGGDLQIRSGARGTMLHGVLPVLPASTSFSRPVAGAGKIGRAV